MTYGLTAAGLLLTGSGPDPNRRLGEHRGVLWDRSERPSEPKDLGEAAASDESQPCDRKGSGGQDLRHPCEDEMLQRAREIEAWRSNMRWQMRCLHEREQQLAVHEAIWAQRRMQWCAQAPLPPNLAAPGPSPASAAHPPALWGPPPPPYVYPG
eukprot:CAMPEP_0113676002 /NCGR_PEP_ID=MMETSP0038_2-20120614/8386_1 /TAXON_ID=2898 /ORGANISM="Cryptomonas paramecium" /LENGTH=153 /DNA_ID=CAMNT_0000592953 /DNA_START=607 /DNA_END=1064 /DNA_ORIENTATION=- /assembly_acc=CAM_ASM_000170